MHFFLPHGVLYAIVLHAVFLCPAVRPSVTSWEFYEDG